MIRGVADTAVKTVIFAGFMSATLGMCLDMYLDYKDKQSYNRGYEEGLNAGIDAAYATINIQERLACLPDAGLYGKDTPEEMTLTFVANDTLAALNKNPLNVKFREDDPWEGQVGYDEFGHAVFDEWEYGIRAAALVLRSYAVIHEIDTVEGIVKRFAEGNQESYIDFLCDRLGVSPADSIDVIARMPELLRAMSRFESGMDLPDRYFAPYDILTKPLTPDNK